jgi:hypothetical protein
MNSQNSTIIYYTWSRESTQFEQKIIDNLVKQAWDIPIISVSQKHLNLGKNICVWDVWFSYLNEWRQILIWAKEATTEYIIFAESDFLYPPDYFKLNPVWDMYIYDNIYIVMNEKYWNYYWKKKLSEWAQICKRELLIERYEKHLEWQPEWFDWEIVIWKRWDSPLRYVEFEMFTWDPCVSFKTWDWLRTVTNVNVKSKEKNLPYWWDIKKLRKEYLWD